MQTLTIRKPDDWHAHLRDGDMLKAVAPFTAQRFGRAIVMPNLAPNPVTTTEALLAYKQRILEVAPDFAPLMTYYLTDDSNGDELVQGFKDGIAAAVKIYPAGATTNSAQGVTDIKKVYPVLEKMEKAGMPVLLHGETTRYPDGRRVDPYDRERVYIETTLAPLLTTFPALKVVAEHSTTKEMVDFVMADTSGRLASTVTVQHLMLSRGDMFEGGLQPHLYCLPPIKREEHRDALRKAVTSGDQRFFLGTDSAPHPTTAKERATGCAGGVFTAPAAIEWYAQVFDEMGKLENLEKFASLNGPAFYGLTPNEEKITLTKDPWTIDSLVDVSDGSKIRPFGYHEDPAKRFQIQWKLA